MVREMMMMGDNPNLVEVMINGKPYKMKSPSDIEYMREIANTVDHMITEIRKMNKKLDREDMAVLTALNLADRLKKKEDEIERLNETVSRLMSENEGLKRNIEELTKELNDFITAFDRSKNFKL
ncbi:cell division protein ZapA [Calorimonas adulescens]|uniref:Cell division protein ZapA n=2 Tax=Calorimonas adulescens TaxID=2606906 RepID=A0A5D8QDN9_9THEO|nr:cell division protein ZapA [Calorimonas adulescens]